MKKDLINFQGSLPSLSERQSTRTTFRVRVDVIESLNWMKDNFNMTGKNLIEAIIKTFDQFEKNNTNIFQFLKEEAGGNKFDIMEAKRRTMVLSKETLRILNDLSQKIKTSRDLLLNGAIITFKILYDLQIKETREKHKKILDILERVDMHLLKIETNMKKLLGENDPIFNRFGYVMVILENLISDINKELETGEPVNPDEY